MTLSVQWFARSFGTHTYTQTEILLLYYRDKKAINEYILCVGLSTNGPYVTN